MGKAAMCIQMLQILNSGRVYKVSELASLLETNPRNIIEYKRELEEAGYYIISVPGKFGGYRLDNTSIIPSLKFTEEEKKILQVATDYLKNCGDFLDKKLYQEAMSKVFSSTQRMTQTKETFIIPGVTLSMSNDEIMKRYRMIESCIVEKIAIEIDFLSVDNEVRKRIVEPYKILMYNDAWFVIGFCRLVQDIRCFKFTKIQSFRKTNIHYRIPLSFNESDYFDQTGFKKGVDWRNGNYSTNEWVHIKLLLHKTPAMYVKQYIYGINQVVTPIDKNNTILECDMHYKYNTIKFVLGFGTDCEVLEPTWVKDEVLSIAKQMANNV